MKRSMQGGWLAVLSLCAASALAEDAPLVENVYVLPKKKDEKPKAPVDPKLQKSVGKKVVECYEAEQKAKMSEEDIKLIEASGKDLVHDLAPALYYTSCELEKPASDRCLQDVANMDCASLAEPIISEGWDRHLTPEAKKQVRDYATVLATREGACRGYAAEEAKIVNEIRVDKLSILIEAQIVMGKCQMLPEKQAQCAADVASESCEDFQKLSNTGAVETFCDELFICKDVPLPDEEPEK